MVSNQQRKDYRYSTSNNGKERGRSKRFRSTFHMEPGSRGERAVINKKRVAHGQTRSKRGSRRPYLVF